MPIYKRGDAWRVVVWCRGLRKDTVVHGTLAKAQAAEFRIVSVMDRGNQPNRYVKRNRLRQVFVYFIQAADGPIKIGVAVDVQSRLLTLQTDNHHKLTVLSAIPGSFALERSLHGRFAHARMHGEWFRPDPELVAFIGQNTGNIIGKTSGPDRE